MFEILANNLKEYEIIKERFFENNLNKNIVFMCIGTNKYFLDSFGAKMGDKLKQLNFYVYGSSKREINGKNYINVYNFIRKKHKKSKIIIIDSVYLQGKTKPMIVYKSHPINVSGINSKNFIGDEGLLFNSFSYQDEISLRFAIDNIFSLIEELIDYKRIKDFVNI